jgi:environmental stress-induced protein Ves
MAWRIVGAAGHRVMPWKNGGGATAEIAIGPDRASVAGGFDWRVSIATVATDGPFSAFPGYDRLITLLGGKGMILTFDGHERHVLDRKFEPFAFAGERATTCRLVDGACEDLNLMVARDRLAYRAALLTPDTDWRLGDKGATRLLFLLRGAAELADAAGTAITIGARDTLIADPGDEAPAMKPDDAALALYVALTPAPGARR